MKRIEDEVIWRFWGAIDLYEKNFFEESIIKSALAVEIALAIRLNQQLNEQQKEKLNKTNRNGEKIGVTFGSLKKEVKDSTMEDLLENINSVRNCYIRYYNLLVMVRKEAIAQQLHVMEQRKTKQLLTREQRDSVPASFAEKLLEIGGLSKSIAESPDFSWLASTKNLEFIDKRMDAFWNEVENALSRVDIAEIQSRDFWLEVNDIFNYPKRDALDVLDWSHKVLKSIGVF
jgi:hypothetical protein